MDVEILKKINSLAKTLHTQGLASNMDDATRLASCMVGTKHTDVDTFSAMARTQMSGDMQETKENDSTLSNGGMVVGPKRTFSDEKHPTINEQMMNGNESMLGHSYPGSVAVPQMPQTAQVAQAPQMPTFEFNKMKTELDAKVTEISGKLTEVETHSNNNYAFIKQIGDEIDKINDRLKQMEKRLSELNNAPARTPVETASAPAQPQLREIPKEAPKEQANARTGDHKPGDFDIRSYFYSGSDKK